MEMFEAFETIARNMIGIERFAGAEDILEEMRPGLGARFWRTLRQ